MASGVGVASAVSCLLVHENKAGDNHDLEREKRGYGGRLLRLVARAQMPAKVGLTTFSTLLRGARVREKKEPGPHCRASAWGRDVVLRLTELQAPRRLLRHCIQPRHGVLFTHREACCALHFPTVTDVLSTSDTFAMLHPVLCHCE